MSFSKAKRRANERRIKLLRELTIQRPSWTIDEEGEGGFAILEGTYQGHSFRLTSTGLTYGFDFYFAIAVDVGTPQTPVLVSPDAVSDALMGFGDLVDVARFAGGRFVRCADPDYARALVESEAFSEIFDLPVEGFVWRGPTYMEVMIAEEVQPPEVIEAIVDWAVRLVG